ncbi:DUF1674 domain-containing protein [Roseomonas sp. GC11]|uniref:succinate dehydrogenase assembly factor 4 n=1 Tax=Roseomonas sp. GC11 TaxID=2950546 RepID=UPI00210F00D4|nr:succinate dehydrogenase assembly factor 4 [Roseomonas sp. GC11]MCQ4160493.1 DUF1674 domain-containing protein [Roseomonas sp. GC11]
MTKPEQEATPTAASTPAEASAEAGTEPTPAAPAEKAPRPTLPPEIGGPAGPEPTRFGDWERKGRVSDF